MIYVIFFCFSFVFSFALRFLIFCFSFVFIELLFCFFDLFFILLGVFLYSSIFESFLC